MKSGWIETDVEPLPEPRSKQDYRHKNSGSDGDGGIQGGVGCGNPGRPRGALNRTTRAIKEAAVLAAECSANSDGTLFGYLKFMSDNYPVTFTRSILSRLIPYHLNIAATARLETAAEVRTQLAARGIPIDRLTTLFEVPKVPSQRPLVEPADENRLQRDPEPDRTHDSAENGLDRQHEPSRRRYGANEPVRDVRSHPVTILSPSLGGWHALGQQLDLPIDEKEPTDADRSHDPEAA
jgi:hypothetical protein